MIYLRLTGPRAVAALNIGDTVTATPAAITLPEGWELTPSEKTVVPLPGPDRAALAAETAEALRAVLGWTAQRLADELGLQRGTVNDWRLGRRKPRGAAIKALFDIARANLVPF